MVNPAAEKIRSLLLHDDVANQRQGVALLQAMGDPDLWREALGSHVELERREGKDAPYRLRARRVTSGMVEAFFLAPYVDFTHVRSLEIKDWRIKLK